MKARKFVSEYIKSKDLARPITVTIISVEARSFEDPETKRKRDSLVVFFKELDQGVVLCKASTGQLIELCSTDETDEWVGKKVVLFRDDNVTYMGKKIGGLRFRAVG